MAREPLLELREVGVDFATDDGTVRAVEGVNLAVGEGECVAVVGESGSGKSQLFLACLGLLAANGRARGSARFAGRELIGASEADLGAVRGQGLALVAQDPDGAVLSSVPVPGNAFGAIRLKNGNTLVSCGDGHRLVEMDKDAKIVWSIDENELPGIPLRFVAGVQRLPNGNTVVCNWLGHGFIGNGTHMFEITRDKKVLWTNVDHATFKTLNTVQLLDVKGDCIKGQIVR